MKPIKLDSGRWQARYHAIVDGERVMRSGGTFANRRDAQDAINVAEAKVRRREWVDPRTQRVLFEEWAERWYAARLTPSRKYRALLDARLLPRWSGRIAADITALDVASWVKEMVDDGCAPATVRSYYRLFKQIMADAVEHNVVPRSPCRLKAHQLPTVRRSEQVFLTREQAVVLIALAPPRYAALVHMGVWTGLRIGELTALRWDAVDLEAGVVHVRQAVRKDRTIGLPKGGRTRRVLIDPATVERLRTHRRDFGASEWVFSAEHGGRIDYDNFRRRVWGPLVAEAQLDPVPTIHDLRHTHCGLMIEQGMDWIVLSDRMGHHKPSFTMDVYGHRRHDADEVVRAALAAAVGVSA